MILFSFAYGFFTIGFFLSCFADEDNSGGIDGFGLAVLLAVIWPFFLGITVAHDFCNRGRKKSA